MSDRDQLNEAQRQMVDVAKQRSSPEAYTDLLATGFFESVERYLDSAGWEAAYVERLLVDGARASGGWPDRQPGSLGELVQRLHYALRMASDGLSNGQIDGVAKGFSAVAVLWKELRDRDLEVQAVRTDVQRDATRTGEEAAEKELRALAAAGEIVVGAHWRDHAAAQFTLGGRATRRVWDKVAMDFPRLSSSQGKPRRANRSG